MEDIILASEAYQVKVALSPKVFFFTLVLSIDLQSRAAECTKEGADGFFAMFDFFSIMIFILKAASVFNWFLDPKNGKQFLTSTFCLLATRTLSP